MSLSLYERQVNYRIKKVLQGKCYAGGCHVLAKGLCPKHLERQRGYEKKHYARLKAKRGVNNVV